MPTDEEVAQGAALDFSLVAGGPFHRIAERLELVRGTMLDAARLSAALIAITWVPLVVLAVPHILRTGAWPPLLADFVVHARFLVAIPLLFMSDALLDLFTRRSLDRLHAGRLAGPDDHQVPVLATETERLRDGVAPELAMAVVSLAAGILLLLGAAGGIGPAPMTTDAISAWVARGWYTIVSYPLFLFFHLRALWRWILWCRFLWRLSRLRLRPEPTHPDRSGGFAFLASNATGFAPFFASLQSVAAAGWLNVMVAEGASSQPYLPKGALLLGIALLVTLGPLALFVPHLQRARISARREYGQLALDYGRTFHRRWMGPRDPEQLVGTGDIEPLVNLSDLYAGILDMRIVPFGRGTVLVIAAIVAAPVGALVLTEWPLKDVALGLLKLLIGAPIG